MIEVTPVAILDNETLEPIFESTHVMGVDVRESVKVTKYAVEDGTIRNDHIVREPVEISIDFVLDTDLANDFAALRQAQEEHRIVAVQTRGHVYESLVIEALPHAETAETANTIRGVIELVEWREVEPDFGELPPRKVRQKRQSNTQKTNKQAEQYGPELPEGKRSMSKRIGRKADEMIDVAKSFFGGKK